MRVMSADFSHALQFGGRRFLRMGCGASRVEPQPGNAPARPAPGPAQSADPQTAVESQAGQGAAPVAPAAGTDDRSGKASAKAPPPSFAALIDAGTVVPDEHDGPYALRSYHANVTPARIEGTRARRATTRGSPPTRR